MDPGPYTIEGQPRDEIPVKNQEHRVVLTDLPKVMENKPFYTMLAEIQRDFPEVIMHVHGLYSFNTMFGLGFASVDVDARADAAKGNLWLPNGKHVRPPDIHKWSEWINLLGYSVEDMRSPKMRCKYTIRSAQWASRHWDEPHPFRTRADATEEIDTETPTVSYKPSLTKRLLRASMKESTAGDMIACDVCSLASTCKAYRAGSVCSLPDSDGSKLARHFETRDSDAIIDGLQAIITMQAERAEEGRRIEQMESELSSEVTRIVDGLFNKGVQLAKLVDPARFAKGPLVQINQGINGQVTQGSDDPAQIAARAIAQLEEAGYKREDITKEMVDHVVATGKVPLEIVSADVND